ncbi:MAG TPA: hypothetical protein VGJ87_03235 [Roseiflexaceae bacterium]
MNQQLERRIAALEARGGADVIGVLYENNPNGLPDGLVRVNGSEARLLTPEEFAYDYPNGRLIRILYVENWRE